jgi:hypothetical protein
MNWKLFGISIHHSYLCWNCLKGWWLFMTFTMTTFSQPSHLAGAVQSPFPSPWHLYKLYSLHDALEMWVSPSRFQRRAKNFPMVYRVQPTFAYKASTTDDLLLDHLPGGSLCSNLVPHLALFLYFHKCFSPGSDCSLFPLRLFLQTLQDFILDFLYSLSLSLPSPPSPSLHTLLSCY